jgi:hypothetical protein
MISATASSEAVSVSMRKVRREVGRRKHQFTISVMPRVEYAAHRPIRTRNKPYYRLAHWPIWIWVFFLSAGPVVFRLFAYGPNQWTLTWLGVVLVGTGIAAIRGQLPGVEPAPYILRFTEDKPNPLYRRICYTFAWNVVVNFVILNWIGLAAAAVTQHWYLRQIYSAGYFPIAILIWTLRAKGTNAGSSTVPSGLPAWRSRSCGSSGSRCRGLQSPT